MYAGDDLVLVDYLVRLLVACRRVGAIQISWLAKKLNIALECKFQVLIGVPTVGRVRHAPELIAKFKGAGMSAT